ncbi:hypothetical protein Hsw_2121 [Hymenobacter swuensis DY53]|uniref:Uncharacterized protein n=1 Tax=Hymenobacter swuensis DY53 TaxID=1227739 RepID=W8F523_9BACT|nr:hypothetical protein Hsw_2121 [Hymenobacter swuensis DY53]
MWKACSGRAAVKTGPAAAPFCSKKSYSENSTTEAGKWCTWFRTKKEQGTFRGGRLPAPGGGLTYECPAP